MRRIVLLATIACAVVSGAGSSAQQADPLQAALAALGGAGVNGVRFTGFGASYPVGQNPSPNEPWPRVTVKSYDAQIDYRVPAMRVEIAREQGGIQPRGGGQPFTGEQRVVQWLNGTAAWEVPVPPKPPPGPPGAPPPGAAPAPPPATSPSAPQPQPQLVAERTLQILMTPHGFLKAAVASKAATRRVPTGTEISFTAAGMHRLVGTLNAKNQVERVQTWIDNPVLGDMLFEAVYQDYEAVGGLQFPMHITQRQGGHISLELWLSAVAADPVIEVTTPDTVRSFTPPPVRVVTEKIGDGIYYLTGGSHHSVAIEMRDHVVVVEAPLDEARSLATIATVKELVPGKPIRFVVNTHHHFDHAGGLRTYVDEGATVVTHEMNRAFLTTAWSAPRTLDRDRLAVSGKTATFQGFTEKTVLTDGTRVIEIHRIANSPHHDGFAMVYLPAEKMLIEADAYTPAAAAPATSAPAAAAPAGPGPPPAPVSPTTINLYENIRRLTLTVDRIAALHGPRMATMADLEKAVGRATN